MLQQISMSVKNQKICVTTTALTLMGVTTAHVTKAMFLKTIPAVQVIYMLYMAS